MNDNWWTMKKMIEGREREMRLRMEQIRPWLIQREAGVGSGRGGNGRKIRYAIGRALLAWGSALIG